MPPPNAWPASSGSSPTWRSTATTTRTGSRRPRSSATRSGGGASASASASRTGCRSSSPGCRPCSATSAPGSTTCRPTWRVIDHHAPAAAGDGPVLNPHLAGLDGERVLSTAALAYMVANRLADCRDLAGLAAAGVIGDGQAFEAENAELLNEGIANGVLEVERGLALPGRSIAEQARARDRPVPPRDLRGRGPGPRAPPGLARRGRPGPRPPPLARRARHGPGGGAGRARVALGRPGDHAARADRRRPDPRGRGRRLRQGRARRARRVGLPPCARRGRPRPARSRRSTGAA